MKVITESGEIMSVDEYSFNGVGMPSGWRRLDEVDPVILRLAERIELLEEIVSSINLTGPQIERERGW